MSTSTPLQVIACDPPRFSPAEARALAQRHYGLSAAAAPLVGERDQNYLLDAGDGGRWVLKIANADEDPQVTDFQIKALLHIATYGRDITAPVLRRTEDGAESVVVERDGARHTVRVVSYLQGKPLENGPLSAPLARAVGRTLAHLGQALQNFEHRGPPQALLWDMKHALALRELLTTVRDRSMRDLLMACLDDFEHYALPAFPVLRSQVIHNDLNPGNILVNARQADEVAGVIDFGDLQYSPLIVDVAVAAAYWRNTTGDPLELFAELVAGYHAVSPLSATEAGLLYDLVCTRLATTVTLLEWRTGEAREGDNYLDAATVAESSAAPFLRRLRELPRDDVSRRLRQVCASVSAAAAV